MTRFKQSEREGCEIKRAHKSPGKAWAIFARAEFDHRGTRWWHSATPIRPGSNRSVGSWTPPGLLAQCPWAGPADLSQH